MILEAENSKRFHTPCSCKGAQKEMEELVGGCDVPQPKCISTTIPSQGQQDGEYRMMRPGATSYVVRKEG